MTRRNLIVDPSRLIFALDIGTRSIVGLVCYPEGERLRVLTTEIAYHPQRDMLDGQIHNIAGVVTTARELKKTLEKRLGLTLGKVAVAAAGRALKTKRHLLERELFGEQKVRQQEIASLELEAVQKAQEFLFLEEEQKTPELYYCVGYTTVGYFLDGYPITSLVGQRGKKMGIEVLATFLPQVVIDSLLTVVEQLNMTVHNLTLEPIAALHVTIPPEYRSLNLALVDVGAGTADIAITHKGSVTGYAMVPLAGDEVTEQLAETYLLDFQTAEKLKLKLSASPGGQVSFKDILGNSYRLPSTAIVSVLEPVVEKIAEAIAAAILEYNGGPPRAVFFIGGGSQTPLLREKLAACLGLSPEMVAIRGREIAHKIIYTGKKLKGPESITPFGIALSALQRDYFGFSYVTVNGKVIRLLDTDNLRVGNVLVTAGYSAGSLLGRRSPGLRIFFNNEEKVIPGNPGENAVIMVNGRDASLETVVKNNDCIEVIPARSGPPLQLKAGELCPPEQCRVYCNGESYSIPPRLRINGLIANPERLLQEGDRVEFLGLGTVTDFLELLGLNGEEVELQVNGRNPSPDENLKPGDRISVKGRAEGKRPLPGNPATDQTGINRQT
ncbi:MAG: cell division FtsA domain-containing protein [Bacillota bacterium]